jgi:hypothetical protein
MERLPPVNISEKRIDQLKKRRTMLMGEIAEIDMEIQRIKKRARPNTIEQCTGCMHCKPGLLNKPFSIADLPANKPPYESLLQ